MMNVLVTGVGGPLGQALIKALRQSALPCRVLGTDRSEHAVGFGWVDRSWVLPDCSHAEDYLAQLRGLCAAEKVAAILPSSEPELVLLSRHAPELVKDLGVVVVASPPKVLAIGLDKRETCRFLREAGLNFPRFASLKAADDVKDLVAELGFPLIAKPCRGSGSRGLFRVNRWEDIAYLLTLDQDYLLQEYLRPDDQEYTVGAFRPRNGQLVGSIAMKRELMAGVTYRAWVAQNFAVGEEARRVVEALRPLGPCNVQMRLTARGPVTFEINPRFSSTTAMRAHFGYNEVDMALRDLVLHQPIVPPQVRSGMAMRFWEETYQDA